ncbi:MAG: 4-(cytidine 5'-diphospho)-2-C-methyl-D-erythritol kinase [Bacteroidota bacterium]
MLSFPHCKINLGLRILHKRSDGYHELQTIFYPIKGLSDALEIIRNPDHDAKEDIVFTSTGLTIAGTPEQNLCIKAYRLLKKDFPELPKIKMHLHKVIPMGAGLGGGSSDGAAALMLMNEKFQLGLSQDKLLSYALQLGSDCPFFIFNKPCYATGRGEQLSPLEFSLEAYKIVIAHPGIHVSTATAFKELNRNENYTSEGEDITEIIQKPISTWKSALINDFQLPVIKAYPEIGKIINKLYEQGAIYASLSGSGSAVYGIFEKDAKPEEAVVGCGLSVVSYYNCN